MTRIASIAAAIVMVVLIAVLVSWGVDRLLPLILRHPFPRWLPDITGAVFAIVIGIVTAWRNRRPSQEDERLTPLLPRSQRPL